MSDREIRSDNAALASPPLSARIVERVREGLVDEKGLLVAIVYGSATSGTMRTDSDVDIALLFDKPLSVEKRLMLLVGLSAHLKREVDIVDLHGLGGEILRQVLAKGEVVIKNDPDAYFVLLQRMVYNEEDFMPQVRRALRTRVRRFANA